MLPRIVVSILSCGPAPTAGESPAATYLQAVRRYADTLLAETHELTGEARYLNRADHFARQAMALFLTDGHALPRASSAHDHGEAIIGARTLVMALLDLWTRHAGVRKKLDLVITDR
jgi:hypothetical protein